MKTKIKIIEYNNGSKKYIPVYKNNVTLKEFIVLTLSILGIPILITRFFAYIDFYKNEDLLCIEKASFLTLIDCQQFIDNKIADYKKELSDKWRAGIKTKYFIKYP